MLVKALKSFGGQGVHVSEGQVFELPEGSDWLRAGLVEVVEQPQQEAAVAEMPAKAMKPAPKTRTRK